jgi:hypothetical protein
MSSALTTRPPSCLRRCKNKDREIVKAKTHNRKSKNSKLQQRRGEIETISPFCVSTFSGFRLSLIRVFFFASSQAGRRPSGQGAGHYNQDVDTVVGSILKVSRHLL